MTINNRRSGEDRIDLLRWAIANSSIGYPAWAVAAARPDDSEITLVVALSERYAAEYRADDDAGRRRGRAADDRQDKARPRRCRSGSNRLRGR